MVRTLLGVVDLSAAMLQDLYLPMPMSASPEAPACAATRRAAVAYVVVGEVELLSSIMSDSAAAQPLVVVVHSGGPASASPTPREGE